MKQLIELINFKTKNDEGSLRHISSYHKDYSERDEINVHYCEDVEGCIETVLVTPSEYWVKLKATPLILKGQTSFVLSHLKEVIGENSDLIHLDTEYALSLGNICYYLLYNFEVIEATLHIETLKVTVQKKDFSEKMVNYKIPKMDYLSLVALVIEKFKEEDIAEYTKLHCTKCNHTYYAIGQIDRDSDKCIYCESSDDVVIAQEYKVKFNVG